MAQIVTSLLDLDRVRIDAISELLAEEMSRIVHRLHRCSFVATIWLSGSTLGGHASLMREKTR
jgi:hypothetical protein